MNTLYRSIVALHGLAGLVALVTFWFAAFAHKGSPVHRGAGRWFVRAMVLICVTALPMALVIGTRSAPFGVFLLYLIVITGTSVWLGHRAVHWQGSETLFRGNAYRAVAWLSLVAGATTLAVGVASRQLLLMGFSFVGLALGSSMLVRRRNPMAAPNWKVREHFGAMIGGGAATHVAFMALGLNRVAEMAGWTLPQAVVLTGWIVPSVTATVASIWLDRRFARGRVGSRPAAPRALPAGNA